MKTVLVTGGCGCLGSWVIKLLIEKKDKVICLDTSSNINRLKLILDENFFKKISFNNIDIFDFENINKLIKKEKINFIVHLAAFQVPFVKSNPILGSRVNVEGTVVLYECAVKNKNQIEGFVSASSIGVFGDKIIHNSNTIKEDTVPYPLNLYGVYKLANEGTGRIYFEENQINSIILRPYIIYGPGRDQGWTSAPTKAILHKMLNKGYTIPFSGSIYLHYAKDCAEQFLLALESNLKGCNIFNVTGETINISDFIKILNYAISNDCLIDQDFSKDFPIPSNIDISKNDKFFKIPELTNLTDGITETIDYLRHGIQNNLLPSSFIDV